MPQEIKTMREFFHGWRRKAGSATLVLACLLATAWIRSSFTGDYVTLVIGKTKLAILSQEGTISVGVFRASGENPQDAPQTGWWTVKLPPTTIKFVHYGYGFPYWGLIVPLSLLSAWLLIWNMPLATAMKPLNPPRKR
jgi:hypothetical protein